MSDTMVRPETTETDTDDPKVAHYVLKKDQMRGYFGGEPITALCGKKWVPSRDYEGLPICEECKQIAARRGSRSSN